MISVRPAAFERWPDAWLVSRPDLELVIAPSVGRILRFARPGGPNALWDDTLADSHPVGRWVNWGGEKIWFWPQADWPSRQGRDWPPPEPDGSAAGVEPLPDGLRWHLAPVPGYPFTVTRTVTLEPTPGSPARITTQASSGAPRPWSVTQINRPTFVQARAVRTSTAAPAWAHVGGPAVFAAPALDIATGEWSHVCPVSTDLKLGLDADQLRALTPAGQLTLTTVVPPADLGRYAAGEFAQVFSAADTSPLFPVGLPPYAELEFVASPGSSGLTQLWQLA